MYQEKITELRKIILEELSPLINSDYVLLNLPYHANIGDTLIWEGEESFLATLPYKCKYRSSIATHDESKVIEPNTTILLHGGGNFGDLWEGHQKFRIDIIKKYPDNPVIIFPQTVHYTNVSKASNDGALMGHHKNLTICVRDQRSYELLSSHFTNNIKLLPDMAFCIDPATLRRYMTPPQTDVLLLKRTDKELSADYDYLQHITRSGTIDVLDWPTKQQGNIWHKIVNRPIHRKSPFKGFADFYAYHFYRPYLLKMGVKFLSKYNYIYTTRLHGAILSTLLEKPYTFFDNSYGKNRGFFDAWLTDLEGVTFNGGNNR